MPYDELTRELCRTIVEHGGGTMRIVGTASWTIDPAGIEALLRAGGDTPGGDGDTAPWLTVIAERLAAELTVAAGELWAPEAAVFAEMVIADAAEPSRLRVLAEAARSGPVQFEAGPYAPAFPVADVAELV